MTGLASLVTSSSAATSAPTAVGHERDAPPPLQRPVPHRELDQVERRGRDHERRGDAHEQERGPTEADAVLGEHDVDRPVPEVQAVRDAPDPADRREREHCAEHPDFVAARHRRSPPRPRPRRAGTRPGRARSALSPAVDPEPGGDAHAASGEPRSRAHVGTRVRSARGPWPGRRRRARHRRAAPGPACRCRSTRGSTPARSIQHAPSEPRTATASPAKSTPSSATRAAPNGTARTRRAATPGRTALRSRATTRGEAVTARRTGSK